MLMSSRLLHGSFGLGLCLCVFLACDEKPEKATLPPAEATATAAPSATPKPAGPPDFEIDTLSAKVGVERALLDQRDGRTNLVTLLKPTA